MTAHSVSNLSDKLEHFIIDPGKAQNPVTALPGCIQPTKEHSVLGKAGTDSIGC
jgi:hypothetical protein